MRTALAAAMRAAVAVAALTALSGAVEAQSFLQNLFGMGQQPGGPGGAQLRPGAPAYAVPQRSGAPWSRETSRYSPGSTGQSHASDDDDGSEPRSSNGKYRTVCVRTCDGYYFPISNSVPRARFMRDQAQCRASCGEEARLFYMPSGSDDTATMLDLAGRSYLRMPNAFKYRKTLIDGCSCRPMPWSEAELQRHRQYAAEAEQTRLAADTVAGHATAGTRAGTAKDGSEEAAGENPARVAAADGGERPQPVGSGDDGVEAAKPGQRFAPVADRGGRGRAVSARAPDRPAARRQQAAVRAAAPASGYSGLGGFLPASGGKYTWPGDASRR